VGSHIKPWRDSENAERLDGENGLLLTPSIDHLFDRGFISFKNDGAVLISPVADERSLKRMGVEAGMGAGELSRGQRGYLEFHRDEMFLTAERTRL
jgi:putative restriction endonuclease